MAPHPALAINPHGHLYWSATGGEEPWPEETAIERIGAAFALGIPQGLLHLASRELDTPLPAGIACWRELGRLYLTGFCHGVNPRAGGVPPAPPVPTTELQALLDRLPPIQGGEYLTFDALAALWEVLDAQIRAEAAAHPEGPSGYLKALSPSWRLVGRVCFHLAENRRSEEYPFAFLATYAVGLSAQGRVQYQPLAAALKEYAGKRHQAALLHLLAPVQAAAEQSALTRELLDSRSLFQPLAWTPTQAYRFLQEVPPLDASGVVVRLPDLWAGGRPPRPQVTVRVGQAPAQGLGLEALLDFQIDRCLDGEPLTDQEWQSLMASAGGLVLIRGRWVEADPQQLRTTLDHWRQAVRRAGSGVSLAEALRLLSGVAADGGGGVAAVTEPVAQWSGLQPGDWLATTLARLRDPAQLTAAGAIPGLLAELRPYQRTGVSWLRFMSELGLGACLADDMGLGKTVQILALLLARRAEGRSSGPSLLVAPASLLANWRAEIERFAPDLTWCIVHPAELSGEQWQALQQNLAGSLAGCELVLTTYGLVARLEELQRLPWDLVVLDEAQAIKNPSTRQSRGVKKLAARQRLVLTGTPVENRLSDLWSIFDFLNPGLLGSARQFGRFVKARGTDAGSLGGLRSLVRPYILRRMKTDRRVIADLPEKTEVKAWCGLAPRQAALYGQAVRELAEGVTAVEGIRRRGMVLASLMRLKQICNHPSQWLRDGVYAEADSGKLQRLRRLVEEIVQRQEKALVFTQFQEMTGPLQEFLNEVFGRPGLVLHGGTPVRERRRLVDTFQSEQGPPFLVLTVKVGGTGLNLTEASHVIHFDRWWNPAVENQATDRAFRIGQRRPVLVHQLVCRGTVEERIDEMLERKSHLAEEVLSQQGGERLLTEMGDQELLRFVSLDLGRSTTVE
ncbi:MAG: DEAD/DEAH box helicase [Candidatus Latescibacterota bacterium]